MNIISEWARNR